LKRTRHRFSVGAPRVIAMAALLLAAQAAPIRAAEFHVSGYYKNFSLVYHFPSCALNGCGTAGATLGSVSNRLRLDTRIDLKKNLTLHASYALVALTQDHDLFATDPLGFGIDPFAYRANDVRRSIYPSDISTVRSFQIYQNIDRAFVTASLPVMDISIGRQAIAWGSARMINPTDVIAPYAFTELDAEYRVGVDALRVRVPIGPMGELDAGYVAGKDFDWDRSATFLRTRAYLGGNDLSLLAIGFREHLLLGLDLERSMSGAGLWLEMADVFVDALGDGRSGSGPDYFRVSTGIDYAIGRNTYAFIEYHFNQAGSNDPKRYLQLLDHSAYRDGSVYLLGKHYLIPGLSYDLTALIKLETEALLNLGDPSILLTPRIEYNVAQDIYLAGGAYVGLGRHAEGAGQDAQGGAPRFKSEFGAYPDFYYTSFRVYF
jgi:hypothetical protein